MMRPPNPSVLGVIMYESKGEQTRRKSTGRASHQIACRASGWGISRVAFHFGYNFTFHLKDRVRVYIGCASRVRLTVPVLAFASSSALAPRRETSTLRDDCEENQGGKMKRLFLIL